MKYKEILESYKNAKREFDKILGDMALFWESKINDVKVYYSYGYNVICVEVDDIALSSDNISTFEHTYAVKLCYKERTNYINMKTDEYKCTRMYVFEGI